jgi:hypothetical protein
MDMNTIPFMGWLQKRARNLTAAPSEKGETAARNTYIQRTIRACHHFETRDGVAYFTYTFEDQLITFVVFDMNGPMYNLGDILNMPTFYHGTYTWPKLMETAKGYPTSIAHFYVSSRANADEFMPSRSTLQCAVSTYYIRRMTDDSLYGGNDGFVHMTELCARPTTLCVHLRSGDYGNTNDAFLNKVVTLASSSTYDTVVLLIGIHFNSHFQDAVKNTMDTLNNLKRHHDAATHTVSTWGQHVHGNHHVLTFGKFIVDSMSLPDEHIVMMSKSSHLLVHFGGFSQLGAMVFSGTHLYMDPDVLIHDRIREYTQVGFGMPDNYKEHGRDFFDHIGPYIAI